MTLNASNMLCVHCGKELNKLQRLARAKRVKLMVKKGKKLAGPFCSNECAGYWQKVTKKRG